MTQQLAAAFAEASKLSDAEQDALASVILLEIESERRWDELFARPESQELLARLADKALHDHRAGRTRKLDVSEL